MQASHDLVIYNLPISDSQLALYDHVDFPGAVPRTFLGAFIIGTVTSLVDSITKDGFALQIASMLITRT
jgi:alpha-1,6-mannosyltransferase